MNEHKNFIKECYHGVHGNMCDSWKQVIEERYPEFKNKLDVGKWYIGVASGCEGVLMNCQSESGELDSFGFDETGEWYNDVGSDSYWGYISDANDWKPATRTQVVEALTREAKRRGYKEGAKIKGLGSVSYDERYLTSDSRGYYWYHTKSFWYGNSLVMKDGEWAEILEEARPKANRWYKNAKNDSPALFFITDNQVTNGYLPLDAGYGITHKRKWSNSFNLLGSRPEYIRPANRDEVEKGLIEEAIRRRLWNRPIKCLEDKSNWDNSNPFAEVYSMDTNKLWSTYGVVFKDGVWADPLVNTITKEEAEKQLGKTIV